MTLGEGKRKVLMLLDEYSTGGSPDTDEDINLKMNDFFDIAQRDIAQWQPVTRRADVVLDGTGEQELPADVYRVLWIRRGGSRARDVEAVDGALMYPEGDTSTVTLEYLASPGKIGPETEDDYEFEVSEEAAACLPFFVAAQQLLPDLVVDYGAFYNVYLQMKGQLDRTAGGIVSGSGGGVKQRLFA